MTRLKAGNPYVFLATSQKSIESDTISWRYDSKTGLKTIEEFPSFRAMHNVFSSSIVQQLC